MIPTLETERLRLVAPDENCISGYLAFYTNEEESRFYGGPLSEDAVWTRLKADLGAWYLMGFGVWAIYEKDSGQFIGTCGFWKSGDWPRELTWWLLNDARRKGYATEASRRVIEYAYHGWHWDKVETYCNDLNVPARVLIEKLGGSVSRREIFPDGKERDIFLLHNTAANPLTDTP